jgi:hypothetical protein
MTIQQILKQFMIQNSKESECHIAEYSIKGNESFKQLEYMADDYNLWGQFYEYLRSNHFNISK